MYASVLLDCSFVRQCASIDEKNSAKIDVEDVK